MVSVIVPAYNAEKTIGRCLECLMKQDCTEEFEVIVIDDGSVDSTPEIIAKFRKVKLIHQENAGPAAARNRGAAMAEGEIILFTDSDCFPEHNWISEMIKPFKRNIEIAGVKGSYKTRQKQIMAKFVQLEYEDKYGYMQKNEFIDFIDTYSAAFKKKVFLEMNGYDTDFPVACAEDVELSYRLSNKGYKMVFNPGAVVYHLHPDTLPAYLKKKYKFAYWRMLALKKNPAKTVKDSHTPQLMKMQLLFPPVILGSALLSMLSGNFLSVTLFLLAVFLLTTVPFAMKACRSDLMTGLLSPVLLFFRAAAQCLGVSTGLFHMTRKAVFNS
jgi:glycosyltransferase involved in cell wall biosynthesis